MRGDLNQQPDLQDPPEVRDLPGTKYGRAFSEDEISQAADTAALEIARRMCPNIGRWCRGCLKKIILDSFAEK
jgi:hypothetical protein